MNWRYSSRQINVTRDELYEKVWEMPLSRVAEHYDSEYWRLRAACKTYNIPVPPAGYWMKTEAGKPVPKRPPLPPTNPGARVPIFTGQAATARRASTREQRKREYIAQMSGLSIIDDGQDHSAVSQLRRQRREAYGTANPQLRKIHLAPLSEAGERSFQIMNTIAQALSTRGFRVVAADLAYMEAWSGKWHLRIRVREKLRQNRTKVIKSSPPTIWDRLRGDWEVELEPSGAVECEVDGTKWADKPGKPVEEKLPNIVAEILARRDDAVADAAAEAEAQERRHQQEQEREAKRRAKEHENAIWRNLVSMADQHHEIERVRALLLTLQEALPATERPSVDGLTAEEWLARLHKMVVDRDPLLKPIQDILEYLNRQAPE